MSDELKFELPQAPQPKQRCGTVGVLLALMIGIVAGSGIHALVNRSGEPLAPSSTPDLLSHDELIALADKLERNQLYVQAARAWQQASATKTPEGDERAETLFRIGKNLNLGGEHDEAVRYLLAAEAADDKGQWSGSINKMMLESLSALGLEDARAYQAKKRISLAPVDDKPIAEIGGEPITSTDLDRFARQMVEARLGMQRSTMSEEQCEMVINRQLQLYKTDQGRQQLLQAYLSQELLYREALAEGMEERQEVRSLIIDTRRKILTQAYMNDYLGKNMQLSDTDLHNAYEATKTQYVHPEAVKVAAIVVNENDKKAVDDALSAGIAFEELHAKYADKNEPDPYDRWLERGGRIPLVKKPNKAKAHLLLLDTEAVSPKWFETDNGMWVKFKLTEKREPRQLEFDECRDRVERILQMTKQRELKDTLQKSLQSKYEVVIHEGPTTQPGNDG